MNGVKSRTLFNSVVESFEKKNIRGETLKFEQFLFRIDKCTQRKKGHQNECVKEEVIIPSSL